MKSVWSESCKFSRRPSLDKDISVNTLVIGAGMAGILTAYMLKENDIDVAVIEGDKVASGNISGTTAKITSQHHLIYKKLVKEFGEDKARQYAKANELAIKKYKEIVENNNIQCDFEEKSAYIYSTDKTEEIMDEFEAVKNLGIDAELVDSINDLPFKISKALKFNNQAQFNPLKFLKEISKGLTIYEDTRALEVDINTKVVRTNGGKITAKNIVIATHFPIINAPGYYFMRMHQERSYIIALENAKLVSGMYIDANKDGNSFRSYNNLLLLGGCPQRTGKNEKGGMYDKLRAVAKELYPEAKEVLSWSSQDCMTMDGIPYIGEYAGSTNNIYVATGFNKWGMTSSMVSAMIISDMILGKDNDFSEIFSPGRFDMTASIGNLMSDGYETAKNFIAQRVHIPKEQVDGIEKGHGGIVEYNGEKVGVYKDKNGEIFTVTTKCPHLGCELQWNADEHSWDCPCHGSRFDYKGNIIDSPTTRSLVDEE